MKAKRGIKITVSVLLAWFIIHVGYVFYDGTKNPDCTSDVAVVFGNKVNEDGTLSPRLKARLDKAVELYHNKKARNIIVSGGLGKEGFYEGDKMKEYLVEKLIPDSLIIVDNAGNNTESTIRFIVFACRMHNFKSVTVVSQWFHITRAKHMLRKVNFELCGASPNYLEWRDFYAVTREFFAFYRYIL
jgi:vancomycin permeability regulator SanA